MFGSYCNKRVVFQGREGSQYNVIGILYFMPECSSSLVNKVGNGESITVILKRFDALSPAALENSSDDNDHYEDGK